MPGHIKVVPLAAESLGVRSMCTYVETSDVRVLLDAGASLCPSRFGLPPHPKEFEAIVRCRKKIAQFADKAEVVTISHYHFDHHTPSYEDWLSQWTEKNETARQIYQGKLILMKNPRECINASQRHRGWLFQQTGGKYARKWETADDKSFLFGSTLIRFSKPVFHGSEDSSLGWVLMTTIEFQGERLMFAPDVQGPISPCTLKLIIQEKPDLILLGGPPLYLAGFRVEEKQIQAGLANLKRIIQYVPTTILEHHVLRDEKWDEKLADALNCAFEAGHAVLTAAQFLGESNTLLEAKRRTLFKENPPSKDFERWMKLGEDERKLVRAPI